MQNVVVEYRKDGNIGILIILYITLTLFSTQFLCCLMKLNLVTILWIVFLDKLESASIHKFMHDIAERWRTVSMELYCVQSMLEEVVAYWKRWKSLSSEVENWIDESQLKLDLPEEQKLEYFQVINHKFLHKNLNYFLFI